MPPKVKITKEDIIKASLDIIRESGPEALNARAVSKRLGSSTQPIFSNYSSMELLKKDVIQAANKMYNQCLESSMRDTRYPPYKQSGMGYIRFAKEEKELFKLLFMRDRSQEETKYDNQDISELIKLISENTGLNYDDAIMFHTEMWIYVHGIATMIATSYLNWDWETVSRMLTDAYEAMKDRYAKGGK